MKKAIFSTLLGSLVLAGAFPVYAKPAQDNVLELPESANHSGVIYLGSTVDKQSHELVDGYAIVHYKKGQVKPQAATKPARNQCYGFMASGAKWKEVEPWVVNPSNIDGLDESFVASNLASNIAKWEDAADGVVGNGIGVNILGSGSVTSSPLAADTIATDGLNEVYFGEISDSGAIAVTIVWGIFSGPTFNRRLVEWDQIYDDVDFDWGNTGAEDEMDLENIATHELGHSIGLADLYNTACSEETMYGYGIEGETKKRDLNTGDIAGTNALY